MTEQKPNLLFVDDDLAVLQGLRRMLWSHRNLWKMNFVESGAEALNILESEKVDVLITDMRMPGMDGLELLSTVQEKFPDTVRVALSGQADKAATMKVVHPAHQYLSKPCSAEIIKNTISKSLGLRSILSSDLLIQAVTRVGTLPSLPDQYQELIEELNSPDTSIQKVGKIVAKDVGMSAMVLKIVNSAFFGFFRQITDPVQAVNVLGLDTLQPLVISHHLFSEYTVSGKLKPLLHHLGDHSMNCAALAKKIATDLNCSRQVIGNAFIAGMLHDIGILVFAAQLSDYYLPVYRLCDKENLPLWYAETETFGASHAELGAYLLGLWGIEDSVLEAIAFHHQPMLSGNHNLSPLTAVHLANYLDHSRKGQSVLLDHGYIRALKINHLLEQWERQSETEKAQKGK